MTWLNSRATFGYDVTNREDTQFWPTGEVNPDFYPEQNTGELNVTRAQTSQLSVDLGASATYKASSTWGAKTSVGGQFFRNLATNSFARGRGLSRGARSIFGSATTEASDDYLESRSIGGFIEQQMSLRDRLFLTAGLRIDNNSSFGKNFNAQPLPKASVSWLMRDDQNERVLNTFRLRSAYGQSSQQPGVNDARRFYTQAAVRLEGTSESGVSLANLGNPDLKPEKSQEVEAGFDAGLFRSRVTVEGTFFYKKHRGRPGAPGDRALDRGNHQPVLQPGPGVEPGFRVPDRYPDPRRKHAVLGPGAEWLLYPEQPQHPGCGRGTNHSGFLPTACRRLPAGRILGGPDPVIQ